MNPEHASQHIYSLLQSNNPEQALYEADRALGEYPGHVFLLHMKSLALRKLGRLNDAIEVMKEALRSDADNSERLNTLGNMLKANGQFSDAEQAFRRAVSVDAMYAPAHQNLVTLMIDGGAGAAAVEAAGVWLEKDPDNPSAHEAIGRSFKLQRAWRKALNSFEKSVVYKPGYLAGRYGCAACLIEIGETEKARDICLSLISEGHDLPQVQHLYARALMELSELQDAEKPLQAAIRAGSSESLKHYANLLWMTERADDALTLLNGAISAADQRPAQALGALDELLNMEKPELADDLCSRLPHSCHDDPQFLSRRSMAKSDLGELGPAFSLASMALKKAPRHPVIVYQFIVSALMSGRYNLALQHASEWRTLDPQNQNWIALKGDALRMLGRDGDYRFLNDFERLVKPMRLSVPSGYTSLEDFHADFIDQVHGSSEFRTHPLGQSARQGIQSPRNLLHDHRPVVQNYIKMLYEPVAEYLYHIGRDADHPLTARNTGEFYINGVWSISLMAGGRHVSHTHPNGWVSSAYYMAVPPEAASDPERAGWIKFGEPPYKLPVEVPAEHWVCPEPGTLVLFPAYMWHGTVPISGKSPRVTAPLDVMPGAAP